MVAYIYILECSDGTYYTGWTTQVERRVAMHQRGKGARYTRARLPVTLCYVEEVADRSLALKREYQIKQLSRVEKVRLIDSSSIGLATEMMEN
ncbi:GIY-YIG nuclease family protein [Sulfoacidibacillus ferrooxidans]|uniref:GIY-YIG domain-containing protein n=1 Tax=Sulfoacidibacillus ferrooxidans TaxID=2005001 RepID=A0A9X1V8M6_9BACL|nr:hypothetical protein [Sulfoacidibacillus ferrooxidans]